MYLRLSNVYLINMATKYVVQPNNIPISVHSTTEYPKINGPPAPPRPKNSTFLMIFVVVLQFLGSYASLNTFVELKVEEKITGESLIWAPILGNKKLI